MDSSYKIALAVRETLDEVTSFVPHVAASGGTLLTMPVTRSSWGR